MIELSYFTYISLRVKPSLVPKSRSSVKVSVKYKVIVFKKKAVAGVFMFHKHILLPLHFAFFAMDTFLFYFVSCFTLLFCTFWYTMCFPNLAKKGAFAFYCKGRFELELSCFLYLTSSSFHWLWISYSWYHLYSIFMFLKIHYYCNAHQLGGKLTRTSHVGATLGWRCWIMRKSKRLQNSCKNALKVISLDGIDLSFDSENKAIENIAGKGKHAGKH